MNVLGESINNATVQVILELYCDQQTEGENDVRWEINTGNCGDVRLGESESKM